MPIRSQQNLVGGAEYYLEGLGQSGGCFKPRPSEYACAISYDIITNLLGYTPQPVFSSAFNAVKVK